MESILMLLTMALGVLFLKFPLAAARIPALWTKFIFENILPNMKVNPTLEKAFYLVEHDPIEYAKRFSGQLTLMRISGIVLLIIAITGFCIIAVNQIPPTVDDHEGVFAGSHPQCVRLSSSCVCSDPYAPAKTIANGCWIENYHSTFGPITGGRSPARGG